MQAGMIFDAPKSAKLLPPGAVVVPDSTSTNLRAAADYQ
jgi:hypothetical protein